MRREDANMTVTCGIKKGCEGVREEVDCRVAPNLNILTYHIILIRFTL